MLEPSIPTGGLPVRRSVVVPKGLLDAAVVRLDRVAAALVAAGVSAHAITASSVVVAAAGGVLLGFGWFGPASVAMVVASLGDALDGAVARRSRSASVGGALFDASADRYEEFFFLGGLAVFFRGSVPVLLLALAALAGSFMVSYGSAKAEGLAVAVPAGAMRRAERAICLCAGVGVAAVLEAVAGAGWCPSWMGRAVVVATLAFLAVAANASAIRRLRRLAQADRARTSALR